MDHVKRIWYLSPMRAAMVQASPRMRAVSPEPSLLAHTSSESRGTFRQKARSLAPLNGWACTVKFCNDGMLEDTNSLDGAHLLLFFLFIVKSIKTSTIELLLLFWSGFPIICTFQTLDITRKMCSRNDKQCQSRSDCFQKDWQTVSTLIRLLPEGLANSADPDQTAPEGLANSVDSDKTASRRIGKQCRP